MRRRHRARLDDVVVAGAAADIAFELMPDGFLVEIATSMRWTMIRPAEHDHAGGAVAALQAVIVAERPPASGAARCPWRGPRWCDIGAAGWPPAWCRILSARRPSTWTTQAPHWLVSAADMGGPVRFRFFAQQVHEEGPVLNVDRDRPAVYRQFDC